MAHRRHGENDCVDGGGGGGGDIENDGRVSNASSFSESREPLLNLKTRMNTTSQIAIVGAKVYPIESLDYEYEILSLMFFNFSLFISQLSCGISTFYHHNFYPIFFFFVSPGDYFTI